MNPSTACTRTFKRAISLMLLCHVGYVMMKSYLVHWAPNSDLDRAEMAVDDVSRMLRPKVPAASTKSKNNHARTNKFVRVGTFGAKSTKAHAIRSAAGATATATKRVNFNVSKPRPNATTAHHKNWKAPNKVNESKGTTKSSKSTKASKSTKSSKGVTASKSTKSSKSTKATKSMKASKNRRLTEIRPDTEPDLWGQKNHARTDLGVSFDTFLQAYMEGRLERTQEESSYEQAAEATNTDEDDGDDGAEGELEDPSPCNHVDPGMPNNLEFQTKCRDYLAEPYIQPDCTNKTEIVPRIYHSVSATNSQFYHQLATAGQNPTFQRNHLGNEQARDYIEEKCGPEAAQAYDCLEPPAYRADLFRFCALSAEGGVYLDQDILPFVPLEELYSPCSVATVGHDFPWNDIKGKQMKILAGAPGAPIFQCAVERIVRSVKDRYYPSSELALTGPQMLEGCYQKNSLNVAITYHDTRNAAWPYTGMRAGQKILAYEIPISGKHFWQEGGEDENDYTNLFQTHQVYKDTCALYG